MLKNIQWVVIVGTLVFPSLIFAQDPTGILEASRSDVTTGRIVNIILAIAQWLLAVLGVIAVIIALWAAFQFITGGSNEDQIKKAKKTLLWALIGVLVAILAFSIVTFGKSIVYSIPIDEDPIEGCGECPDGQVCVFIAQGGGYQCVSQ